MKNKVISSYLILLSIATLLSLYIPKNEVTAKEEITIPNEAIRLRILANSDSESDQNLKRKVRDAVNAEITKWVQDLTSLEEARKTIQSGLPEIQQIAETIVQEENSNQAVNAEFDRVKFPTKLYGQFLYPAGEYEAILITIGEGEGANWWCVLFPPLCFLDFSNGVAVSEGFDEDEENTNNKNREEASRAQDSKAEAITSKNKPEPANATDATNTVNKTNATDATNTVNITNATDSTNNVNPAAKAVSANVPVEDEQQERTSKANSETANQNEKTAANQSSKTAKSAKQVSKKDNTDKAESKKSNSKSNSNKTAKAPVFTGNDEQEIEVKFFVKELWTKIF